MFGLELGVTVLIMVIIAVAGSIVLRVVQRLVWPETYRPITGIAFVAQLAVIGAAILLASVIALYPTGAFLPDEAAESWYIVPKDKVNTMVPGH